MVALEGTIKEFCIADILQLICQQQKSGILIVEYHNRKAEIFLAKGTIALTRSSARPQEEALGQLLNRAGLVSQVNIQKAYEKQKETFRYLGEILITEKMISEAHLEKALLVQIYETLYEVLQWKEGTYQFDPKPFDFSIPYFPQLNMQSILLDVLRMIDEWPDVKCTIPSFNVIFEKSSTVSSENLKDDALLIFNLVDGKRTTQQIIDESLLGRFNTCKMLAELLQVGYIHQVVSDTRAPVVTQNLHYYQAIAPYLPVAALLIMLVMSTLLSTSFPENVLPLLKPNNLQQSCFKVYQQNKIRLKIEKALALYRIRWGIYPEKLDELVKRGIVQERDITAKSSQQILYKPYGNTFVLNIIQKE